MRRQAVVALVLLAVVGCSAKKPVVPAEALWAEADQAFEDEAWQYAVERYKVLLDEYPFDPNAEEAELRIARAHFYANRYPEAITAFIDFERMHPTSANLPYVEYHLGLAYLAQSGTTDRDTQPHTHALTYFRNLIDRFPASPWAERARLRTLECREALASHEADIAGWYLRQGNVRAAEARLRGLLEEYPDTYATARTLHAFADVYVKREEPEGAALALATLVRHHPAGKLARDARKRLGEGSKAHALLDGDDPLGLLLARIERVSGREDRLDAPPTVSAYPEIGGIGGTRY